MQKCSLVFMATVGPVYKIHMCRCKEDMIKTVTGVFMTSLRWGGELKWEL
jgi:hypothetical protein